jgi:hypothetical protein
LADLLVIEFPSEAKAEDVREMLLAMQKEYLIELGDAFVAVKEDREWIKVNQLFQPVARGVVSGMLWGLLVCSPFFDAANQRSTLPPPRSNSSWPISASVRTSPSRRREHCDPVMPLCFC